MSDIIKTILEADVSSFEEMIKARLDESAANTASDLVESFDLQEISKKTLGSYITKANRSISKIDAERDQIRKKRQDLDYSDWDLDSVTGRDEEGTKASADLRKAKHQMSDHLKNRDQKLFRKSFNREGGIYKATNRLTKD